MFEFPCLATRNPSVLPVTIRMFVMPTPEPTRIRGLFRLANNPSDGRLFLSRSSSLRSETGLPNIRIFGLQRAFSTIHLLPDSTRALSASFRIATRQTNRISAEYPHPPTAPRPRPGTRTQSVRSPVYSVLAAAKRACSRLSSCWPFFSSL